MKRIAIFIDGTWNRPDAEHPTNVLRLSRCVEHQCKKDETRQFVIYAQGVGSDQGSTLMARKLDRAFGGGFGWGSMQLIESVYRQLIYAYEPDDEIYVFGFSRGAFAARSLVGLIRCCGILPRYHLGEVPNAVARYMDRSSATHPEDPSSYIYREKYAPLTATSDKEYKWRRRDGKQSDSVRLRISYVGVWDTVGALGLPAIVPGAKTFNQHYEFHDTELSSSVMSARHAVALDERRKTFPAHLWSNLDELNGRTDLEDEERFRRPFLQQWFPGDHGSVGGGGSRIGLSSIALHWIAQGAEEAGLEISWEAFDKEAWRLNIHSPTHNKFGPTGIIGQFLNWMAKDREGPTDVLDDLSVAALDRFRLDDTYRPKSLNQVYHALFELSEDKWGELRKRMIARDGAVTHKLESVTRPRGPFKFD